MVDNIFKTASPDVNEETLSSTIRYVHEGWNVLADQDGYPGVKPPWGTLNAIDLNSGELLWKIPLGEFAELSEKGIPQTGTPNLGGPVVTAGGLVFIAATKDEKFRAFDKSNGQLVWEYKLPAGGYATPSTYEMNGKQYIVIAAGGGGKVGSPSGDAYVAFCLK
jgi:quinoprotein glucose dehydrogenase